MRNAQWSAKIKAPMKDYLPAMTRHISITLEPIIYAKLLWYQTSINKNLLYNTIIISEIHRQLIWVNWCEIVRFYKISLYKSAF